MIRLAVANDIEELKMIWKVIFGDDPSINDYFSLSFSENTVLVYEEDQKIVSMLHMIPCNISKQNGYYLYALATEDQYRNLGIMGKMIKRAHEIACEQGKAFTFLSPADAGLSRYYQRYDYEPLTHINKGLSAEVTFTDKTQLFVQHELEQEPGHVEERLSICWLDQLKYKKIDWINGAVPF